MRRAGGAILVAMLVSGCGEGDASEPAGTEGESTGTTFPDDTSEGTGSGPVSTGTGEDASGATTDPTGTDEHGDASTGSAEECFEARLLWFEDFENGNYDRWTSKTYGADWGDDCDSNALSQEQAHGGSWSNRSEITCAVGESHRGYGGLQFDGDEVVESYTNTGSGIEAPYGVVNTYWSWLETPYVFENGRWFSFWTVNNSCDWTDTVITLGLENDTWRLTPAHIVNTGGTVEFVPDAPAFPRGQWVRTTIYINYHEGRMHLWQDGAEVLDATFSRSDTDMCQWHWGAYASGDNDDVVLYEDDNYLWKLEEPWLDFSVEPWFDHTIPVCD